MKRGFSLVELIVVIAVIAVLLSITVPVISKVRQMAYRMRCRTNLHGIAHGLRMFLDDNDNFMPDACRMPSLKLNDKKPITHFLDEYVDNNDVYCCPADLNKEYFKREGTSYEFNAMLAGKQVSKTFLVTKGKQKEKNIHVLNDYKPFHGEAGKPGAVNYLYADCHIGNLKDQ